MKNLRDVPQQPYDNEMDKWLKISTRLIEHLDCKYSNVGYTKEDVRLAKNISILLQHMLEKE
jgi:hypothetical protein